MAKETITWKMNGKEYVGRLGSKEIQALETTMGVGVYKIADKMGLTLTKTTLALAAIKLDAKLDAKAFDENFDEELDAEGMSKMGSVAMELIQASGVLGREKKDPPAS